MSVRDALNAANAKIADNADYLSTGSVSKAKLYKEGIMTLITLRASLQERGGTQSEAVRFDQQSLTLALKEVDKFLSSNRGSAGKTTRMNMRCYRS
tara:strand:- start:713 stop:1000 length:288 start_codon:yes stop_codon:yes gene_type:complete